MDVVTKGLDLHEVTGEGKDGVGDGGKGIEKVGRDCDLDNTVLDGVHTSSNHGDNTRNENAQHTDDRKVAQAVESSRQRQEQRGDGKDACIEHGAELAVAKRGEREATSKHLATTGKDGKAAGSKGQEFTTNGAKHDVSGVTHGVDVRVAQLELDQLPRGVCRKDAEEDDDDEAGDHADGGEGRGERSHAIGDDFGNHQNSHQRPREVLVLDGMLLFGAKDVVVGGMAAVVGGGLADVLVAQRLFLGAAKVHGELAGLALLRTHYVLLL